MVWISNKCMKYNEFSCIAYCIIISSFQYYPAPGQGDEIEYLYVHPLKKLQLVFMHKTNL